MLSLTSTSTITSLLYLVSVILIQAHGQLYEGSKCFMNGSSGTCKLLPDCTPVYNLLLSGVQPKEICGYSDFVPIVCCPNEDGQTNPAVNKTPSRVSGDDRGALARAKCKEYSRYVYQVKRQHTPICSNRPVINEPSRDVIGGSPAIAGEYPHMVALGYNTSDGIQWRCGGSLVSKRFVLTAAHCLFSPEGVSPSVARVGDLDLGSNNDLSNPRNYKIIERLRNPEYKPPAAYHDIGLLKLETDVEFNEFVRPACLQTTLPDSPENITTATGWGLAHYESEDPSDLLLKVTLNIVNQSYCNESYTNNYQLNHGIIADWQICAGQPGHDTCQGDSGGPLLIFNDDHFCMYNVVGVTSLGKVCGIEIPGIYTKVYYYIPWLESVIWAKHD